MTRPVRLCKEDNGGRVAVEENRWKNGGWGGAVTVAVEREKTERMRAAEKWCAGGADGRSAPHRSSPVLERPTAPRDELSSEERVVARPQRLGRHPVEASVRTDLREAGCPCHGGLGGAEAGACAVRRRMPRAWQRRLRYWV